MITPTEPTTPVRPETPSPAPEAAQRELGPGLGFASVLIGFLLAILLSVTLGLLLLIVSDGDIDLLSRPATVLVLTLVGQFGFLGGVWFGLAMSRTDWRETLALRPVPSLAILLAMLAMFAASVAGDWVAVAIDERWPNLPSTLKVFAQIVQALSPGWLALAVLALTTIPAVVEEWLCRGLLFTALQSRWSPTATIFATAAVFGALHCDPLQSPVAFLMGLFLGVIRLRTDSVVPCIAAHATNNAVAGIATAAGWLPQLYDPSAGLVLAGLNLAVLCVVAIPRTRAD